MHRLVAIVTIALAVLAGWAQTARADTTGSASTDPTGIGEKVGVDGELRWTQRRRRAEVHRRTTHVSTTGSRTCPFR